MTLQDLKNEMRNRRDAVNALVFPDVDRETFKNEVVAIADILLAVDLRRGTAPYSLEEYIFYVMTIREWLKELYDAFDYRLCEEMTFCIKSLIAKWDPAHAQRLVVFTLGDYQINKKKRGKDSKKLDVLIAISTRTGVPFTKEPVFIHVPDAFKDHILTNIILFHEVGHFVDFDNSVTDKVYDEIEKLLSSKTSRLRREWFPRYIGADKSTIKEFESVVKNHINEYIADIFGAQYAHAHILCYLSFVSSKHSNEDSLTHPSPNCRKKMVDTFLKSSRAGRPADKLLEAIMNYMPGLTPVNCPFSEAELMDANLQFADVDQMLSAFSGPWNVINREIIRNRLRKGSIADYNRVVSLGQYVTLDNNIKRAIGELANRP